MISQYKDIKLTFINSHFCHAIILRKSMGILPMDTESENNQLLQLCTARTALSDSVIRSAKTGWNYVKNKVKIG